jgi:hypothetical protein
MIHQLVSAGSVIPFLGAGASLGKHNPPDAPWKDPDDPNTSQVGTIRYVPNANELARYLAELVTFPLAENENAGPELPKIAQYCLLAGGGRPNLRSALHTAFNWDAPIRPIHKYLASRPKDLIIITTNYDDIIERAFREVGRAFDVIIHTTDSVNGEKLLWIPHGESRREILANEIPMPKHSVIYKMHGAVDRLAPSEGEQDEKRNQRGDFVITEDDYVSFLNRLVRSQAIPSIFGDPFQARHFLFLGYSLSDWNFRVVLNQVEEKRLAKEWRKDRNIYSWAIQRDVDPIEEIFWNKRGVDIYRMNLDDFVAKIWPGGPRPAPAADSSNGGS